MCGATDIVKDIPRTSFFIQDDNAVKRPCSRGAMDESTIHSGSVQSLPGCAGKFIITENDPVGTMGAQPAGCGKGGGYLASNTAPHAIYPDLLIWRRVPIDVQGIVYGNGSKAKNVEFGSGHFSLRAPRLPWPYSGSPGRGLPL